MQKNHPDYGKPNGPTPIDLVGDMEGHCLKPEDFTYNNITFGIWADYQIQLGDYARAKGYDAVLTSDIEMTEECREICVFNPNQIKLVDNLS